MWTLCSCHLPVVKCKTSRLPPRTLEVLPTLHFQTTAARDADPWSCQNSHWPVQRQHGLAVARCVAPCAVPLPLVLRRLDTMQPGCPVLVVSGTVPVFWSCLAPLLPFVRDLPTPISLRRHESQRVRPPSKTPHRTTYPSIICRSFNRLWEAVVDVCKGRTVMKHVARTLFFPFLHLTGAGVGFDELLTRSRKPDDRWPQRDNGGSDLDRHGRTATGGFSKRATSFRGKVGVGISGSEAPAVLC